MKQKEEEGNTNRELTSEDFHPDDHKIIQETKEKNKKFRNSIHLFYAPFQTLSHFVIVVFLYITSLLKTIRSYKKSLLVVITIMIILVIVDHQDGSHDEYFEQAKQFIATYSYWVFLGILSSVGLGTGLHTFVLYLGPFIAKVTMAAYECNSTEFSTYGENSFMCPAVPSNVPLTFWQVFQLVQLEALFWGIGTAIGELPPYFVARAAKSAGETSEELAELEEELKKEPNSWLQSLLTKLKKTAVDLLNKLGFFGIMLFASIPNPLFDLAGIMCGHFGISFWTFFGATVIGKAFIKAHMQASFVVLMFSKELLKAMIQMIEYVLPFKNLIGLAWDALLALMLIYFLVSIVNSSVKDYLQQKHDEEEAKLADSLKNKRSASGKTSKKSQ